MVQGPRRGSGRGGLSHRGGKLQYAARKQRAIFSSQRPSLSTLKTKHPDRFAYLERTYGDRNDSSSNHANRPREVDHYDGRQGQRGHGRGRGQNRKRECRAPPRRSSRSMSPNARDRRDAVQDRPCFDYEKPYGDIPEFRSYNPNKPRYEDYDSKESEDDENEEDEDGWIDELDALVADNVDQKGGRYTPAEVEYLTRMITTFRNRDKAVFLRKARGKSSKQQQSSGSNRDDDDGHRRSDRDYHCGKRPIAPPPSRSTSVPRNGRPQLRYPGRRNFRNTRARSPGGAQRRESYRRESRSRTRNNHGRPGDSYSGFNRRRERSPFPSNRPTRANPQPHTSHLPPISNRLRVALNTRTYPSRSFGRALHVQRWLSDRYTQQATFDFGDLPRSEGVKKYYVPDPNDPDRYLNVPRPAPLVPGARGDYYRGAAWKSYQEEKEEWLKTQGCNYPDLWISDGTACVKNDDTENADCTMSDAESTTTVTRTQTNTNTNPGGALWNNRQSTPFEDLDLVSEMSNDDDDLISLASGRSERVPLPYLFDRGVEEISSGILKTTFFDRPPVTVPAVTTKSPAIAGSETTIFPKTDNTSPTNNLYPTLTTTKSPPQPPTPPLPILKNPEPSKLASTTVSSREVLIPVAPAFSAPVVHNTLDNQPNSPPTQTTTKNTTPIAPQTYDIAHLCPLPSSPSSPSPLLPNQAAQPQSQPQAQPQAQATTEPKPNESSNSKTVIIPDDEWNKEWEEQWKYVF